ncbi:MAG TPA: nitrate/nitrite transporter NrtS [Methylomirabilota bacterium]|nr:nitrate/nitrite transporter NrtS [Methylomirabilota bacterium]
MNPSPGGRCDGCGRERVRLLFLFRSVSGSAVKCLGCALRHPTLVKRSLGIAAIVGTVLLAINQGDVLLSPRWPGALAWKVPLTYLVPYLVATWGALLNSRVTGSR